MASNVAAAESKNGKGETEGGGGKRKITVNDVKTYPPDDRFPVCNQTRHCFTKYVEYHKCIQENGEDDKRCEKFARAYRSLCPREWIATWNEQRENGNFPGAY